MTGNRRSLGLVFKIDSIDGKKVGQDCYYATGQCYINLWLKHNEKNGGEMP